MIKRLLFLFNPKSGSQVTMPAPIRNYIQEHPRDTCVLQVEPNVEEKLKEQLHEFKPTDVVAIGGDGTVRLAAETLLNTGIRLGIVPTGSANGLAVELDIPMKAEEALDYILESDTVRTLDMACINRQYSIHLSDIGFNAQLIEGFEQGSVRGMLGYALEFIQHWPDPQLFDLDIVSDGKKHSFQEVVMVVVANAERYGTGAVINPGGRVDDGVIELCVVKNLNLLNLVEMMFKNAQLDRSFITRIAVRDCAELICDRLMPFQVDGEMQDRTDRLEIQLQAGAVQVCSRSDSSKT